MVGRYLSYLLEATTELSGIIHLDVVALGSGKDAKITDHCQTLMWKRPRIFVSKN
jgi:hypothetical protein